MGVDVATYRSRIGCNRHNSGCDVVHFNVHLNFTQTIKWLCIFPLLLFIVLLFINQNVLYGKGTYDLNVLDLSRSSSVFSSFHLCLAREKKLKCFNCPGAVAFIGLLLIIAGIETNPGPLPKEEECVKKSLEMFPYPGTCCYLLGNNGMHSYNGNPPTGLNLTEDAIKKQRLCVLLVDGGSQALRYTISRIVLDMKLQNVDGQTRGKLCVSDKSLLYPAGSVLPSLDGLTQAGLDMVWTKALQQSPVTSGVTQDMIYDYLVSDGLDLQLKNNKQRVQALNNRKKLLSQGQWDILYPQLNATVDLESFDMTLLCFVILNVFQFKPTSGIWSQDPPAGDVGVGDDILRLRQQRNKLAHSSSTGMDDSTFQAAWTEIRDVLVRLRPGQEFSDRIQQLHDCQLVDPEKLIVDWINHDKQLEHLDSDVKRKGKKTAKSTSTTGELFSSIDKSIPTNELDALQHARYSVGLITVTDSTQKIITSNGTGFVVGDGHLMTACHVISEQIETILHTITQIVLRSEDNDFKIWKRDSLSLEEMEPFAAVKGYYEKSKTNLEKLISSFEEYVTEEDYEQLKEVLNKKWHEAVTVEFENKNKTKDKYKFSPDIPFLNENIDVAILKIQSYPGCELPVSLPLADADLPYEKVNIFGYIKKPLNTNIVLTLDPKCVVYTNSSNLEKNVEEAIYWWKEQEQKVDYKSEEMNDKIDFEEEYKDCVITDSEVLLHASLSFVHGTSGSPMIEFKEDGTTTHPVVVGIYLRGYPMFYYKIKKAIENRNRLTGDLRHFNKFRELVIQNEKAQEMDKIIKMRYFIEGGTTMKNLADRLPESDMKHRLFPNRRTEGQRLTSREEESNSGEQFRSSTEINDHAAAPKESSGEHDTESQELSERLAKSQELSGQLAESQELSGQLAESQELSGQLAESQELSGQLAESQELSDQLAESQELSGQLAESQELSGQLAESQELSGQLAESQELSGQLAESQELSGQLSESRELSGQLAESQELSGQLAESQELSGQLTESQELSRQLAESPQLSGQLAEFQELSGQLAESQELSGQLTESQELSRQLAESPQLSGQLAEFQELSGQLAESQELSGQLAESQELSGQLAESQELSGQLAESQELSGQLAESQELSGQLVESQELSGQLAVSQELSGQLAESQELSGQLGTVPQGGVGQDSSQQENQEINDHAAAPKESSGEHDTESQELSERLAKSQELSGQLAESQELSGQLAESQELSGQLAESQELSGQLAESQELSGQLSESRELSGQLAESQELSGQLAESQELSGQLTESQELSRQLAESPQLSGQLAEFQELSGQLAESQELSGQLAESQELSGQLAESQELSGQLAESQELSGQLAESQELSGQLAESRELSGQLAESQELSGQLAESQELSGQLAESQELSGQLVESQELSGQLAVSQELSGQLAESQELSGQLGTVPQGGVGQDSSQQENQAGTIATSVSEVEGTVAAVQIRQSEKLSYSITSSTSMFKGAQTDGCHTKDDEPDQKPHTSSKHLSFDVLEHKALQIRQRFGLTEYFPCKITLKDVMKNSTRLSSSGNVDFHWTLLRELIMVNFEARDQCLSELYEQMIKDDNDFSDDENEEFNEGEENDEVEQYQEFNIKNLNNHDIFITIFNCCDHYLKQVLVSKMILCRLAIPLIYPTLQSNSFCFSLWPFRRLNVDLKEKKGLPLFLAKYPQKVVSFVRLSRPTFSKSRLLNSIMSNQSSNCHPTFFYEDCPLGDNRREITNGLVEASWYLPGGQDNEIFKDTIMFTNLRGDGVHYMDQMKSLVDMSHCLVIILDIMDVKTHMEILKDMKRQAKAIIMFITGQKVQSIITEYKQFFQDIKVLTLFKRGKQKNIANLKTEMQRYVLEQLQNKNVTDIEECASCASEHRIQVDEWSGNCKLSKQKAIPVSKLLDDFLSVDVKKKLLPLQEMWNDISKHTKDLRRTDTSRLQSTYKEDDDTNSSLWSKEPSKIEIAKLRLQQSQLGGESDSLAYMLIEELAKNIDEADYISYFLEWIRYYFDEKSHKVLPELMDKHHECWNKYNKSKQEGKNDHVETSKNEIRTVELQLLDGSIGLEHIFREIGQLYESNKLEHDVNTRTTLIDELPVIAAKLLILGYPLEMMDGDAVNLPQVWIKSVFDACNKILGDKKFFIISILGIQSSGKSTFLNSLFGLQFAVSAGRCTRGIYMQMMPVDPESGLPTDYLLVVDTEGLRAPELAFQRYDHDNELATLALGVADMTIINIKGENTSEMKDVLEIVIHAMLRLKLANANLHFNTSCTFVHQNVSATNAASKMQLGRQKLIELLDEVTREAALEVGLKDTQTFQQVIKFDILKDVWYVPDLWNGEPPMAHVNPGYSRKVASIKNAILNRVKSNASTCRPLMKIKSHILDLWNGILSESFVFSFRNSIEVKAYNIMENEYKKQTWELQEFQNKWILQNEDKIGNGTTTTDFDLEFRQTSEEVYTKFECFFENNPYKDELMKWKGAQLLTFRHFNDDLINKTKSEIGSIREQKELQEQTRKMNEKHLEDINEQAKDLAKRLKGKSPSQKDLEDKFDEMWRKWLQKLSPADHNDTEPLTSQIRTILFDVQKQLQSDLLTECNKQNLKFPVACLSYNAWNLNCNGDLRMYIHKRSFWEKTLTQIPKYLKDRYANRNSEEFCRSQILNFQQQLFSEIDFQVKTDTGQLNVRFRRRNLEKVFKIIENQIIEYNENDNNYFEFLPKYRAMIMVYVSRYMLHVFTEVNAQYDREYSPRAIIEKYRSTTWSFFKNLVDEKNNDIIVATFVFEAMKAKLNRTLQKHVAITIEGGVRRDFSHSKFALIVKILDDLAAEENFEKYKAYLHSPGHYALKWLTEYTQKQLFSNKEYIKIVKDHVGQCMEEFESDIEKAGRECISIQEERMKTFIAAVKTVSIPDQFAKQMFQYELNDAKNVVSEIQQMLKVLQTEIITEHERKTNEDIEWVKSPYVSIYEGLWGCKEVCPLCREPCQKMEDHDNVDEPHTCIQHRPVGLTGNHYRDSQKLLIANCSFLVQSNQELSCSGFKYMCKKFSDCKCESGVYHPYKNYKTYFPEWDIAPSTDMESSKYWMWFMTKFSDNLADWKKAVLPDIPESWKSISKEEARHSLRQNYE